MSKSKKNSCCNICPMPVCGPMYQVYPARLSPVYAPVQNCAGNAGCGQLVAQNYGGCNNNNNCNNGCGFLGGGICTLLIFLLILGNTGLLENRNALTLILLFWICGGFGCGGFGGGCGGFGGFGGGRCGC